MTQIFRLSIIKAQVNNNFESRKRSSTSMPGQPSTGSLPSTASSPASASAHSSHSIPSLHRKPPTQTIWKTRYKTRSGSATTAGPDFSFLSAIFRKKLVRISRFLPIAANSFMLHSIGALFFLSKVWNSYHILDFSVELWYTILVLLYPAPNSS